jgi:hypothetical protein
MKHPAELALHQYLENATTGKSSMSQQTIKQIGLDVMAAAARQFGGGNKRDKFTLRMSNVGRPTCQLWYDKNKPEVAIPLPTTFVMNMMIGDIVEAVFKGILKLVTIAFLVVMTSSLMVQLMILNQLQTGHTETSLNPMTVLPAVMVSGMWLS